MRARWADTRTGFCPGQVENQFSGRREGVGPFFEAELRDFALPRHREEFCACSQSIFESNLQQLSHFGTVALHNERSMVLSNQGASSKSFNLVHKKFLLNLARNLLSHWHGRKAARQQMGTPL